MVKRPTLGGTIGVVLGLVGVAVSLTNYKSRAVFLLLMAVAVLVAVASAVWAVSPWLDRWAERRVRRWVRDEIGSNLPGDAGAPSSELRVAAAEVLGELEFIDSKIEQDDAVYWHQYKLPTHKWIEHERVIARDSGEAHAAVRKAYHEVDRLNFQLSGVLTREYGPDGSYDDVLQSVSDYRPRAFKEAYEAARAVLVSLSSTSSA